MMLDVVHRRLAAAVAFALVAAAQSAAQDPAAIPGVSLLVAVDRPEPVYPVEGRGNVGYVSFAGESLNLMVTLVNNTPDVLRTQADNGWPQAVSLDFEPIAATGGESIAYRNVPYTVARVRDALSGVAVDPAAVGADQMQEATLHIDADSIAASRSYTVRVTVPHAAFDAVPEGRPVRLSAIQTLNVRPVQSVFDELNVLYSSGVRARLEGRHGEARTVFMDLLRRHPTSLPGWYELGRAWAQEGRCREATGALRRVLQLVEERADPDEASARRGTRGAYVNEAKRVLAKCGA